MNMCRRIISYLDSIKTKIHTKHCAKIDGVLLGRGTAIYYKSDVINRGGSISVGDNCLIGRSAYLYHAGMPFYSTIICDGENSSVLIGNNCRINGAYIHAQCKVEIGDNCVIASGVNILDSNGHLLDSTNRTIGRDKPAQIKIGNNVWIGINAVILKNTEIGDNCVIAAGSVVKGTYPANTLISCSLINTESIKLS